MSSISVPIMTRYPQQQMVWDTPKGTVVIRSFCTPDELRSLDFEGQFGHYDRYKSLFTRRESLEESANHPDSNVTIALSNGTKIVAYAILDASAADPRSRMESGVLMTLTAIEVSRLWRSLNIGRNLLKLCLAHPKIEDIIVFLVGYSWTWDLDLTQMSARQYRDMLIRFFESFGFREFPTGDPNVNMKPENMMMARIGSRVSEDLRDRFKWSRYGI